MYNRIIIQLVYTTRSILTSRDSTSTLFSGVDAFCGTAATFVIPTFRFEISRGRAGFRRNWDAKSDKRKENERNSRTCYARVIYCTGIEHGTKSYAFVTRAVRISVKSVANPFTPTRSSFLRR